MVDGHLDGDHLTRLVQALYLFKTGEFEGIYRRIENRAAALNAEGKLDVHNCTNILRSFSHGQQNRMAGSDKIYFTLESTILKGLDKLSDRDLTHLMYAYSVRTVGNPELHKAFEKKLDVIVSKLDYPSLFNVVYYMLFTDNQNRALWQKVVNATVENSDILPLIFYKPFKAAKFYLNGRFKGKDQL